MFRSEGTAVAPFDELTCELTYPHPFHPSAVVELEGLQVREKSFNRDRFHKFMEKYKAILFPAFQIQRALQTKVCGAAFWQRLAERRAALSPEIAYVSIAELLDSVSAQRECNILRLAAAYFARVGGCLLAGQDGAALRGRADSSRQLRRCLSFSRRG